mmetsp:Transcript_27523/g.72366  ORF Transcript_27523/g.72366 Transcript_27523/m.72366 type:complete len:631 (+) Transcript_27523:154-2046(+)
MIPVGRLGTGGDDDDDFLDAVDQLDDGAGAQAGPAPPDGPEAKDVGDAEGADENDDPNKVTRFSLSVLEFLHGLQSQHGLRHANFERYRRYCTQRLARLRLVLKHKNGTRRAYAKKEITRETVKDERFLHILLLQADRAWGYYMQLKHESSGDDRKRHHMLARVVKAAKFAQELAAVVGTEGELCDERSELEVAAYTHWITALMKRETKAHADAIKLFSNAKAIYERLGGVCSEHCRSLYSKRVEEINAQLRYCTFMTGGSAADIDELLASNASDEIDLLKEKIARVVEEQKAAKSDDLSTVEWLGKSEGVQSETLAMGLLKIKKKEADVEDTEGEAQMSAYDDLLGAYAEAMTSVSEEIVAERKTAAPSTDLILNRGFLLDYLTYKKLEHTIARTIRLAETSADGSAVTNVARLYDAAVQYLEQMAEIDAGKEHAGFSKRIAARKYIFRGYRCSLLADGHLAEGRVRETVALLDRSDEMVGLAQAELSECGGEETPTDLAQLKTLREGLRRDRCRLRARAFVLQTPEAAAAFAAAQGTAIPDATLRDNLESFEMGTEVARGVVPLTHFPPQFEAVPPKPLFFDLASSSIEFDFDALNERAKAPEAGSALGAVAGAVAGGIGNLFGWGGS